MSADATVAVDPQQHVADVLAARPETWRTGNCSAYLLDGEDFYKVTQYDLRPVLARLFAEKADQSEDPPYKTASSQLWSRKPALVPRVRSFGAFDAPVELRGESYEYFVWYEGIASAKDVDLGELLERGGDTELARLFWDLWEAFKRLAKLGVLYYDIWPKNVLDVEGTGTADGSDRRHFMLVDVDSAVLSEDFDPDRTEGSSDYHVFYETLEALSPLACQDRAALPFFALAALMASLVIARGVGRPLNEFRSTIFGLLDDFTRALAPGAPVPSGDLIRHHLAQHMAGMEAERAERRLNSLRRYMNVFLRQVLNRMASDKSVDQVARHVGILCPADTAAFLEGKDLRVNPVSQEFELVEPVDFSAGLKPSTTLMMAIGQLVSAAPESLGSKNTVPPNVDPFAVAPRPKAPPPPPAPPAPAPQPTPPITTLAVPVPLPFWLRFWQMLLAFFGRRRQ